MPQADERLRRLIDRQTPRLRRLLQAALGKLSSDALAALTEALERQDLEAVLRIAVADLRAVQAEVRALLSDALNASAQVTSARYGLSFDLVDPNAIRVAEQMAAQLVTNVTLETQQAIRDIVVRAFREGVPPREQAREIMRLVGLTERDARAVDALWRRMIEDGVKQSQADARAQRYADRLLRRRAENIARTEMINASTQGRRLGWQQAADAGYLDPATTRIVWIVTQDDRLCSQCAVMAGVTVGFTDRFTARDEATGDLGTARGGTTPYTGPTRPLKEYATVDGPPLHPSCRCDLALEISEGRESQGTARNPDIGRPTDPLTGIQPTQTWQRGETLQPQEWFSDPSSAPWNLDRRQFELDTPTGFRYLEDRKATYWAKSEPRTIDVNGASGFFDATPAQRRYVVLHEIGHDLDRFLTEGTASRWEELYNRMLDPQDIFRNAEGLLPYAGGGGFDITEEIADMYAAIWDPTLVTEMRTRGWGGFVDFVRVEARKAGMPLPEDLLAKASPLGGGHWVCGVGGEKRRSFRLTPPLPSGKVGHR